MLYKVKVKFCKPMSDLEGLFQSSYIDEQREMIMLFQDVTDSHSVGSTMLRYAIPLSDVESVEIIPVDEDNGQKIFSC